MSITPNYSYSPQELNHAYRVLEDKLFAVKRDIGDDDHPAPKILIVAGIQGSGKSHMLKNTLLADGGYSNYVKLYDKDYRDFHPRHEALKSLGVTEQYQHTESFIWELCENVFKHARDNKYNIILETALDTKAFASLISGPELADYQFEIHLIGCKKEFAHLSTIKRALNSLEEGTLERFVDIATIEASIENAQVILNAFETACMRVSGSQISMYERGFGALKDRKMLCTSRCDRVNTLTPHTFIDEHGATVNVEEQTHRIERTELLSVPCSSDSFRQLIDAPINIAQDRTEAWNDAYSALARMRPFWQQIPPRLPDTLWSYIKKFTV
jgi:hypothetical protein